MIRPTFTHISLEDTDVLSSAAPKRTRHYRRTAPRPVQPCRLTTWEGFRATLNEATWFLLALAFLLGLALNLARGGAVVTTDTDVFGPDEIAHVRGGRL